MAQEKPFTALVRQDPTLDTTVISLLYHDQEDPARSIEVGIAPDLGSNMFRLRAGSHDIIYSEQALLKRMDFTGNFVLWPLPNRVRAKRYTYQGKEYSLADVQRPGGDPMLVHGLVFDLPWHYEEPMVGANAATVTTYIDIDPALPCYAAYPFESRLSLTYTLTMSGVTIVYRVQNKGTSVLPFGFALHPYFSLLSGRDKTFVSVPARTLMESDPALLPTGRLLDVTGLMYAMFDLRQPLPISSLKLDHVYMDLPPQTHTVIEYRRQAMQLAISTTDDFTHVVVYTPPNSPFFCVEHQTCSTDAINLANQGPERKQMAHLLEVQPATSHTGSIHYTLHFK
ncbi:MAG: aldose epimerase [Ktedonobacteraceae bacterium]